MIFSFNKKKVNDFIKVVQYMDKEGIDFEVIGDLSVSVGDEETKPKSKKAPKVELPEKPAEKPDYDPMWQPAFHDGAMCNDKEGCPSVTHYGGELL